MRRRPAGAGLYVFAEAQQEGRPLHAAMRGELERLAPATMAEEHDRLVILLRQLEGDRGADPFRRAVDAAPADRGGGAERLHLHDHAAEQIAGHGAEEERQRAADAALALD